MPPMDRDEARFAQASAQMLETGDLIAIKFQDQERNKKPAGIYWMQAASVKLFSTEQNREIWAYRLPSVLGGILAIFFTWGIGRTLFDQNTALLGALFIGAAPAFMGEATIAKTDAMLLATLCAAMFAFSRIYIVAGNLKQVHTKPKSMWPEIFLLWFAVGISVLIKGPIAPMILMTTILGLAFKPKQDNRVNQVMVWLQAIRPFTGIIIVLACVLPWVISISLITDGRFFSDALGRDMLGKVGSVQERHSGPPGYHLILLPILFWPVSAFLFVTAIKAFHNKHETGVWFLISWLLPAWLIFELTATKLPHYVLPMYPAIALLSAKTLVDLTQNNESVAKLPLRLGALLFGTIGMGIAIAILILASLYREFGINPAHFLLSITIFIGTIIAAIWIWHQHYYRAGLASIILSIIGCASLLLYVLPSLDKLGVSPALATALTSLDRHPLRSAGAPPVSLIGYYEPSIVFLLGTDTNLITNAGHALDTFSSGLEGTLIVESKYQSTVINAAENRQISLFSLATVEGFNYSNGDKVSLIIYTRAQKPFATNPDNNL